MTSSVSEDHSEDLAVKQAIKQRLARALEENDWSLRDLAAKSGVSPMTLSEIYRETLVPSVATLVQLADAIGCQVSEFLPETA